MTSGIPGWEFPTPEEDTAQPVNYFIANDKNPPQELFGVMPLPQEIELQEDSSPPDQETSGGAERKARPRFKVREAIKEDLPKLVEIDLRAFESVYENYDTDRQALYNEMLEKFEGRFDMVGGTWMPVVTQKKEDGIEQIVGFMNCCPTSKGTDDFESWEKTTNDGKLDTLYDENGDNVYIVTLSVDPDVKGNYAQDHLFLNQIGNFIKRGMKTAFFESRMPGLREWVVEEQGLDPEALSNEQKDDLANEYFGLTRERKGKQVPYDRLLKVYKLAGCNLLRVLSEAYQDEPSMNYGVLCTYENPLGELRKYKLLSKPVGGLALKAANSSWITRKMFG